MDGYIIDMYIHIACGFLPQQEKREILSGEFGAGLVRRKGEMEIFTKQYLYFKRQEEEVG